MALGRYFSTMDATGRAKHGAAGKPHPLGRGGRPLSTTAGAPPVRVAATAAARSRRPASWAMAMWGAGEVAVSARWGMARQEGG